MKIINKNTGTVFVGKGKSNKEPYEHQIDAQKSLNKINKKDSFSTLLVLPTGERVIIVMGAINTLESRVSGTLIKYNSCIA